MKPPVRRRRPRAGAESGTTLTEVLVVLTMTTVLAVPLLTMIRSTARIQDERMAEEAARIDVELALVAMADDLRIGVPVASRPQGRSAADTVGVRIADDTGADQIVYWSVGVDGLERIEADPDTDQVLRVSAVEQRVIADGDPVFRYFDAGGRQLDPQTIGLTQLAACTSLVSVRLSVAIDDDTERGVVTAEDRHAARGGPTGGDEC